MILIINNTAKFIFKMLVLLLLSITALYFLYIYVFCVKVNKTSFTHNDIDKVYVINLDKSKDRREVYEKALKNTFGETFFNQKIENVRLRGTYGKEDLIFEEKKTGIKISAQQIVNKEVELALNTDYKVYDKNEPEFFINYNSRKPYNLRDKKHLTMGEFGCIMSHLRAVNDIVKNDYDMAIVFEDDFNIIKPKNFYKNFDSQMKNAPDNFDMIKIDYNPDDHHAFSNFIRQIIKGYNPDFDNLQARENTWMGTAYIVSNKGAKKVIDFIKQYTFTPRDPIDSLYYIEMPRNYNFQNIWMLKTPLIDQNRKDTKSLINKSGI